MLKDFKENIQAAEFIWQLTLSLIRENPIIAGLVLILVFLFMAYKLYKAREAWSSIMAIRRRNLILVVLCTFALAIILVMLVPQRPLPVLSLDDPKSGQDVIDEVVTATWSLPEELKSGESPEELRYVLEHTTKGGKVKCWYTFANYHAIKPDSGRFNWRVMAEQRVDGEWKPLTRWSSWRTNARYDSALTRIKMTGILRVGVSRDFVTPFIYYDEANQKHDGIDIRVISLLAKGVAKHEGINDLALEFRPNEWLDGIARDLRSGVTDIGISDTAALPSREKAHGIRFTSPYWTGDAAVVALAGQDTTDLQKLRLTAWRGTTFDTIARHLKPVKYVESNNVTQLFDKLADREVDAFIDNQDVSRWYAKERGLHKFSIRVLSRDELPEEFLGEASYPTPIGAFVHEKEGALLTVLNSELDTEGIKKSLKAIAQKYE